MTKSISSTAIQFLNLPQYKFKNIIKIKEYDYYPLTSDLYFMEKDKDEYIYYSIEGNYYLVDDDYRQDNIYELVYSERNIISKNVFNVIKNSSGGGTGNLINDTIQNHLPCILNLMKKNFEFKHYINRFKLLSSDAMNVLCDSIYDEKDIINSKEFIINEDERKQILYILIEEKNISNYYIEMFEKHLNGTLWSNKYEFVGYRNIKDLFNDINNDTNICCDIIKRVVDIGSNNDAFMTHINKLF